MCEVRSATCEVRCEVRGAVPGAACRGPGTPHSHQAPHVAPRTKHYAPVILFSPSVSMNESIRENVRILSNSRSSPMLPSKGSTG